MIYIQKISLNEASKTKTMKDSLPSDEIDTFILPKAERIREIMTKVCADYPGYTGL